MNESDSFQYQESEGIKLNIDKTYNNNIYKKDYNKNKNKNSIIKFFNNFKLNSKKKDKKFKKKLNKYYQIIFKYLKFIFIQIIALNIIKKSKIYYNLSLIGCPYDTEDQCIVFLKKDIDFIINIFNDAIQWIFLTNIILFLSYKKIFHFSIGIYTIIYYILQFKKNKGTKFDDHGLYNIILFCILSPFIFIFFLIIYHFFVSFYKKKYIIFILMSIFMIIIFYFKSYFYYSINNKCKNWGYGLGKKQIDTQHNKKKFGCYFKMPQNCTKNFFNNFFDFSKILKIDCNKNRKNERKILINILGEKFNNTTDFAYPYTNKFNENDSLKENYLKKVLENIYDLNDIKNKNLTKPEITLHFDKNNLGRIEINIYKNESLIKERKILYENYIKNKNNNKNNQNNNNNINNENGNNNIIENEVENVLIIYIDALSRMQFFRKFPKTIKIFEEYYIDKDKFNRNKNNNKNINNKKYKINVYQFFKYQNFGKFTPPNVYPMFYGVKFNNKGEHIIKKYIENGFITANLNDFCSRQVFSLYPNRLKKINNYYFDHEFNSIFCDPNFLNINNRESIFKGPWSLIKRCLYGKNSIYYIIEYANKFLKTYKNYPKFLKMNFLEAHEPTEEVIKYLDEPISYFLINYFNNYLTKKTMILFMSDHGENMPNIHLYFKSQDQYIEENMGTLFLILSESNYYFYYNYKYILKNEQQFITPYDIYYTLCNFIDEKNYYDVKFNKGISLFYEINSQNRTCDNYNEDFKIMGKDNSCKCYKY